MFYLKKLGVIMFSKIKQIKKVNLQKAMDIEVDNKSHTFYGNGIVTSNSHAVSYAYMTYITAYLKCHFPLEFFSGWIKNAQDTQDPQKELRELVQDARENGIEILPPSILFKNARTHINNGKIYLGLADIKGVGEKAVESLPDLSKMNWIDLLKNVKPKILSCFIQAGALSHLGLNRKYLLEELNVWEQLTKTEKQKVSGKYLIDFLKTNCAHKSVGGMCHTPDRVDVIQSLIHILTKSPYSMMDDPVVISKFENDLLGINLTCSKSEYIDKSMVDSTIVDIKNGKKNGFFIGEFKEVRIFKAKTGKTKGRFMAQVSLEDETGEIPGVIFADQYELYESFIIRGNIVAVKFFSKDSKSIYINELWQA